MIKFFKNFFGQYDFKPLVKEINFFEAELEKLTDEELKNKSIGLKESVRETKSLDNALPEAFALAREASRRTLKQRPFDVQLIGGFVLHQGKIAEMRTGEGKTLAAVMPAYLNALADSSLSGGVHVITVNDYLARRDAVWMGQIYNALGLSVGCLTHEAAFLYEPTYNLDAEKNQSVNKDYKPSLDKERDALGGFKVVHEFLKPVSRREAYLADVVYGTNHEFGFDYLRDNLVYDKTQRVQRGHYFAIIDEVDSILIDEARTPLIIAAPDTESSEYYKIFTRIVGGLHKDEDYLVDEKIKNVSITDKGIDKIEKVLNIKNIYDPENFRLIHYLEESLKAKALFHRDRQYVVKNDEIIIVDEFTGRLMHGRRYSAGLHQAIEAKEGVAIKQESKTFAQITIQNYFRLYKKISGMTGTAQTSAEEFHKVYNLEAVTVPSNKPMIRNDMPDLIYKNTEAKHRAIIEEVKRRHLSGQPILIGTASIANNELLSDLLSRAGISHEVLNAKNHEREGLIIAQAGKLGAVTVATNMAGRGVDVILGGNPPDPEKGQKIKELGGLHIIGTERHEARRIDDQLRGRAGRQGDAGSSQFFLSLEDDLLRIFGGEKIKNLMEAFNLPEDQPIESRLVSKVVNEAQKKIEGINFDGRKHLLEYDDVLNRQRTVFYKKRLEFLLDSWTSNEQGEEDENRSINDNLRQSALTMLDVLWMNHLENLEAMRESVGMRAYGQRDPLVEYRRESFLMFKEMMENFENWLKENKDKLETQGEKSEIKNKKLETKGEIIKDLASRGNSDFSGSAFKNVGRNDLCPCGSGRKYKKCHGA